MTLRARFQHAPADGAGPRQTTHAPDAIPPEKPPDAGETAALPAPPIDVRNVSLTIITVLAAVAILRYAQNVIIPVVLGVLISYALEPLVAKLSRLHVPRSVGAAVLLLALAGGGIAMVYQLRFQAQAVVQKLPQAARQLRVSLERNRRSPAIEQVQRAAGELERAAGPVPRRDGVTRVQVVDAPFDASRYLMWGSLGVAAATGQLVLILFLAYFLLSAGDLYRRKLVKIVGPSLAQKRITVQILEEISQQIERFLLVQLATSAIVGVVTWLAFAWIGLEQAALWGLLAGVFNSIPYFGPVLVTGTIAVIAAVQFGDLQRAALTAFAAFAITSAEGLLLTPWLSRKAARMNAVAIFIGLLFWGWLWEVWGVLLAVPMMMAIKVICDHVEDFQGVGELLGE